MLGYFLFRAAIPENNLRERFNDSLVVYSATSRPTSNGLLEAIRGFCQSAICPKQIIVVAVLPTSDVRLQGICSSVAFLALLSQYTRNISAPPVLIIQIDERGRPFDPLFTEAILEIERFGLAAIFRTRGVLMTSSEYHHFTKPSGRHCNQFIRTANALVDGAEIGFIAFCCLKFVPKKVLHFYCDTGGICSLALAISSLRSRFPGRRHFASVNTFGSYAGLSEFSFAAPQRSIWLVSASTSGELQSEILRRVGNIQARRIITIFSSAKDSAGSNVLLDLLGDDTCAEVREAVGKTRSFSGFDCEMCKSGSVVVPMSGEQFIPVRNYTSNVTIGMEDIPPWLEGVVSLLAGQDVCRAYFKDDRVHSYSDAFIDFLQLNAPLGLIGSPLHLKIKSLFEQSFPLTAACIIHPGDHASSSLAACFAGLHANVIGNNGLPLTVLSAPLALQNPALIPLGTVVVVAAVMSTGQSLLSISQGLRHLGPDRRICYIVGASCTETLAEFEQLKRDLSQGGIASGFGFSYATRMFLPRVNPPHVSSWDDELAILMEAADSYLVEFPSIKARLLVEGRIRTLTRSSNPNVRGLSDCLFWTSTSERRLRLRPSSIFFRGVSPGVVASQADVFLAVSCVIQGLRAARDPRRRLYQTEYERRVISPFCFDRYNDGVIQASMLRCCRRPELDYSSSDQLSAHIKSILSSIFEDCDRDKGEAAREFVLAIATERLRLVASDLCELYEVFSRRMVDPICEIFWRRVGLRLQ